MVPPRRVRVRGKMLEAILRKEAHHFEEPEDAEPGGPH